VDEAFAKVMKDATFSEQSGGVLTFSGNDAFVEV
jgi:pyruvate-formate lyase-activating enzyme